MQVSLVNEQAKHAVSEQQLVEAAKAVLRDSQYYSASISVAVVDDDTMQELNRRYLRHDYPTDVLSFVLGDDGKHLEGEIIISADTAASAAEEVGTSSAAEQLLYVIHGALHLVGYGDELPEQAERMRSAEAEYLKRFGCTPTAAGPPRQSPPDSNPVHHGAENG